MFASVHSLGISPESIDCWNRCAKMEPNSVARAKSNFTRSQNRLLLLLEEQDTDSRISVIEARKKLESCLEIVLDILENFSDFYTRQKEHKKCERIVGEMLRIEEDFDAVSKATREYLASRKDISQNNDLVSVPIENRQYSSLSNATSNLSMKEVPVKDQMSVTSVGGLENAEKVNMEIPLM